MLATLLISTLDILGIFAVKQRMNFKVIDLEYKAISLDKQERCVDPS